MPIEKRRTKSGRRYLVRVLSHKDHRGHPVYFPTKTFGTLKEAQAHERELLRQKQRGAEASDKAKMPLAAYLEEYLSKANLKNSTIAGNRSIIRAHIAPHPIGKTKLNALKPQQINDYYRFLERPKAEGGKGLSGCTAKKHHALLHAALGEAVRLLIIHDNPTDRVRVPKVTKSRKKALTAEQVLKVIAVAKDAGTRTGGRNGRAWGHAYLPMVIAALTGMRLGEVLALKWSDIDFEQRTIWLAFSLEDTPIAGVQRKTLKDEEPHPVLMSQNLINVLKRARAEQAAYRLSLGPGYHDEGYVCTQRDGRSLRPNTMASNIKRLFVKAGLPEFSMHSLRHTHVTMLLGDPSVVDLATSHRVGHDDVGFTHRQYGHALVEMQRPAAALMDATFGEIQ